MTDLGKTIAHLQILRRKFEGLLDAARAKVHGTRETPAATGTHLREVGAFGANPGNLRMFVHLPEHLPKGAPVVVALHGCDQTAHQYDQGAGWSALADRLGFAVVYAEQQTANNPKSCFSWFAPGDIARDQGEALSIRAMVEHALATFGLDRGSVFVTGLSAGGAMAAVMLATYPEVFAGGAIIAGLPYGCARSVEQAFGAMFSERSVPPRALGDLVRAASSHRGPWPKVSVWHGTADPIVKPSNGEAIVAQWTDVHGLSPAPSYAESIGPHTRRVWTDAQGNELIEAFSLSGMGHGVPLATTGEDVGGSVGPFFLDAGISSTVWSARFCGLAERLAARPRASEILAEPRQTRTEARAVVLARAGENRDAPNGTPADRNAEQDVRRRLDPDRVIAAAFKAAGLSVPELPGGAPDLGQRVAPGAIIEAALKAAGLMRR